MLRLKKTYIPDKVLKSEHTLLIIVFTAATLSQLMI